ncbi:alpha/beta hydrolase [Salinicoccus sp. ID82-1]|uniref:alpha/beta hydrolase n=1 Tax=Salinicoccus sp. ID82-1 TaxID=2820269 RepID=UPI001F3CDAE0|nr:alpha/beta hydrolase [Salinicoccus sp. ID82-1]MCG1009851.1 alpha/beta hydrolase [Salinicoccus sp. ID82-1]
MEHLFIKAKNGKQNTLILFHGSGGRETDLLEVATMVDGSANILALRGDADDDGQVRFFKRQGRGHDMESLNAEGEKISGLLEHLAHEYGLDLEKAIYIGYSNGANMAAHLVFNHRIPVAGAMLMHPAYKGEVPEKAELLGKKILLTAGARDMVATAGEAYQLKQKLELKGASVDVKLTDGGHEIVSEELMEGHVWYLKVK